MSDIVESVVINGVEYAPKEPLAASASVHGMYDCHNFDSLKGKTVDEIIENWRNSEDTLATYAGSDKVHNIGRTMLCPVTVLDARGKELRRVGPMVFRSYDGKSTPNEDQLAKWRSACLADPDIPRLLRNQP